MSQSKTKMKSWLRWLVYAVLVAPFAFGTCASTTTHSDVWTPATAPWYSTNPCPARGPCPNLCDEIAQKAAVCPYSGGCYVTACRVGPDNDVHVTCECEHSGCLFESAE